MKVADLERSKRLKSAGFKPEGCFWWLRDPISGDVVRLREWLPNVQTYTGRWIRVKITYLTNYEQKDGIVVFGFREETRGIFL